METVRPMSILPAIKCSNCGSEIEISSMGDHVCAHDNTVEPVTRDVYGAGHVEQHASSSRSGSVPNPRMYNQSLGAGTGDGSGSGSGSGSQLKAPRTAPPRIDAAAANKPYIHKDSLSPGGHGLASSRSPMTPLTGSRPPRSPMIRSMTSPMPRMYRPPSPELSSNLDCAFPPFPTSRPSASSTPKSRSTSAHGAGQRALGSPPLHAEPESYCGPRSPMTTGGANVLQRMNTIAPGPFDARRRKDSHEAPNKGLAALAPQPETQRTHETTRTEAYESSAVTDIEQPRPTTADKTSAAKLPTPSFTAISPPRNREGKRVPQRPVRPEPLDGFLALLKKENEESTEEPSAVLRPGTRSNTFPMSHESAEARDGPTPNFSRRPSETGLRPRRPTLTNPSNASAFGSAGASQPTKISNLSVDVPPVPLLPGLQSQPHSVHAPSDSASSTSSTRSYDGSSFRSDLSPPVSASSSLSMLSTLGDSLKDQDGNLLVPSLQVKSKQSQSRLRYGEGSLPSSPDASETDSPELLSGTGFANVTKQVSSASPSFPQHIQHSALPEVLPEFPAVPTTQGLQKPPARQPAAERSVSGRPSAKRPMTATKHHCRGCNEPITGKSVKAADGRLTGRYHKHCFVCKTCRSPFATADFYVINNNPYCEHHYHKLNNSLCAKCDHGIEGPYLETQQGPKFHPRCFTCIDCHKVLSDDYYEHGGKVYCDQHAFTALRRQDGLGPKRNMERRTTRLMMM